VKYVGDGGVWTGGRRPGEKTFAKRELAKVQTITKKFLG